MSSGCTNEDYLVGNVVDSSTVSCSSQVQSERLEWDVKSFSLSYLPPKWPHTVFCRGGEGKI